MPTRISAAGATRPAPKWWRNFERGTLMVLIPSAVAILQGWGLDDAVSTKAMLMVNVGLVAVIKFVGMMLVDTEDNYVSNLTEREQRSVDINTPPVADKKDT